MHKNRTVATVRLGMALVQPRWFSCFLCLITPLRSYLYGGLYRELYERAHIIRYSLTPGGRAAARSVRLPASEASGEGGPEPSAVRDRALRDGVARVMLALDAGMRERC
jgi:hypothetical protein